MGNEFFSSDNLKNFITLPSWYVTSLYSLEAVQTAIPGNIRKKGLCDHCKVLTLVLTLCSLYGESCAILICEFNKLFMYKYDLSSHLFFHSGSVV